MLECHLYGDAHHIGQPWATTAGFLVYRISPETYTLALTPETATIEPGKSFQFKATVTKQDGGAPSKPVPVSVKVEVDPASGGHKHGETIAARPKGNVSPSSGNTVLPFTFAATEVSGTHTITATCDLCVNKTKTAKVDVKVEGLTQIPDSPFYALQDNAGNVIGAVPGRHSENHFLTGAAIGKLEAFAQEYQKIVNPGAKLYLNDASLIWGGLFDVGGNWATPHAGHRRGVGLDIRAANSGPNNEGAVPTTAFDKLAKTVAKKGAKAALHCTENGVLRIGAPCNGIPNNRHFHVDF